MAIRWVYRYFPAFLFYSRHLKRHGGVTFGPFVMLKKEYKGNPSTAAAGLIEHELTHVRQFYRTCGLNGPRYLFAGWRLAYEVEAFRAELRHAPDAAGAFAWSLANRYRLGITESEALKLLA